jgi:GAF domain-containing protein
MFEQRHERLVVGLAGQAATAMDNTRLYEAARKARSEAENANRLKDEFPGNRFARIAHAAERNTGLGANAAHRKAVDDQTRSRAIETIERNAVSSAHRGHSRCVAYYHGQASA